MLLIAIQLIICAGAGVAYYAYNKPQLEVAELKAQPVTAVALFKDFNSYEQ